MPITLTWQKSSIILGVLISTIVLFTSFYKGSCWVDARYAHAENLERVERQVKVNRIHNQIVTRQMMLNNLDRRIFNLQRDNPDYKASAEYHHLKKEEDRTQKEIDQLYRKVESLER
jgi:hypothetical protein